MIVRAISFRCERASDEGAKGVPSRSASLLTSGNVGAATLAIIYHFRSAPESANARLPRTKTRLYSNELARPRPVYARAHPCSSLACAYVRTCELIPAPRFLLALTGGERAHEMAFYLFVYQWPR